MLSRTSTADFLAILVLAGVALAITIPNLRMDYDDAYITFRYAYNLASGHGFVYNPPERYLGTTTPLYGLILGFLGRLFSPGSIPWISNVLSGLSLFSSSAALYILGRLHKARACGFLSGLLFLCNPFLELTFGGEMLFLVALILSAFILYHLDKTLWASAFLAIALLVRVDAVFAVIVIAAHYGFTRRRVPIREIVLAVGILAPFMLLSLWYFGSPFPGTLGSRMAQRDSGLWGNFLLDCLSWIRNINLFPLFQISQPVASLLCFALGIPAIFLLFRFWVLPLAWIALVSLALIVFNVPFYHWYLVPIIAGVSILGASGTLLVFSGLRRYAERLSPPLAFAPALLLAVVLAPGLYRQFRAATEIYAGDVPAKAQYAKAAEWLRTNTPLNASVAYMEIGYIGYYSQRKVIDPAGLVNPGTSVHLKNKNWTWTYEHYRPDYILVVPRFHTWLDPVLQAEWFRKEYKKVTEIRQAGVETMMVYGRSSAPRGRGN